MKLLFLVNDAPFLMEFLGKLAQEGIDQGDTCVVLINSKTAEYRKRKFFPKEASIISKVDWSRERWDANKKTFEDFNWRNFFPIFDRPKKWPFSRDYSTNAVSQVYQCVEHVFKKEKPDVVIGETPTSLLGQTALYFSKKNKIPFCGVTTSRIGRGLAVYTEEWTDPAFQKMFAEIEYETIPTQEKKEAQEWVEKFVQHKEVPLYTKNKKIRFSQTGLIQHYIKRMRGDGKDLLEYIKQREKFREYDYESEMVLRHSIRQPWAIEKRQLKIILQKNVFDEPKENEDFLIFPLHMQPEASTSVFAMQYANLLETVRLVAFTLPFPWKLYVKEHPSAVGTRDNAFYKTLKQIPQIKLISPYAKSEELIRNSKGVVTLTSTMGMESAMVGKPTYVLGNVFYSYHPWCRRPKSMDELREQIQEDIASGVSKEGLEKANTRFLISYFRNIISGDIGEAVQEHDSNNYKEILHAIKQKLRYL